MTAGANIRTFQLEIEAAFADELMKVHGRLEALALQGFSGVVQKSPIDTGRFKGNWSVSIGARNTTTSLAVDLSGSATVARGAAVLDDYPVDKWPKIFIQNNLPYAIPLEDGHSAQAPGGMVALTMIELSAQWSGKV